MAGHSKWKNIQHRKGAQDKKRGKIFSKHIRAIMSAVRNGSPDLASNPRLRLIVEKAMMDNMTKDTIERAIKRAAGGEVDASEEIRYEGYGPGGVAVMVDCVTDNRNRTVGEVRHAFTKCGGNLGTDGSVGYLFSKQGQISFKPKADENKIMEVALEAGADDVIVHDDTSIDVITSPDALDTVYDALIAAGLTPEDSIVTMEAAMKVDVTEKDQAEKILRLYEMLEDLDDVQDVYFNADISDELLKEIR